MQLAEGRVTADQIPPQWKWARPSQWQSRRQSEVARSAKKRRPRPAPIGRRGSLYWLPEPNLS